MPHNHRPHSNTTEVAIVIVILIFMIGTLGLLLTGTQGSKDHGTKNTNNNRSSAGEITEQDLDQGCPKRDCIPSIDQPVFESAQEADQWLQPNDKVFGINHKGTARAYPQRILNWHEIVNDTIEGDSIAITFCPLCGSAIAFERIVNGKVVEFGVSGKLYNSNLVMYDRSEESYWQQANGEAIIGPAAARKEKLIRVPIATVPWSVWKEKHPTSKVLSRETGFTRQYDLYPYGTYEEDGDIYFGIQNTDTRLPVKEPVLGFELNGDTKAYTETALKRDRVIEDTLGGTAVQVTYQGDGTVMMTVPATRETIVPLRTFWFAWAAFHPNSQVYE